MLNKILFIGAISCALNVFAGDIAFGKVVGTKVYDFSNNKAIKVYFEKGSQLWTPGCSENGRPFGTITYSQKSDQAVNHMFSTIIAAQMSGKKVRIFSQAENSCEVDFVGLQESYY
ncbi:hypothetical protein [Pseudoalteromonas luteoviolacea]|uniref:Uncharacterized protein n=1 Tax=Pseudoalteromonas luteoviolacea DSM 6061 TaxID=1365250 RepID=A0A161ZUX9_9GAMM|nr:hypothetical protein [Pseudoalteromonas luteoviolacea]KZN33633.1 hypothetical protein N475_19870 [Pseudoalteromonas luteoviolacea DSM 6061]MBE0389543.1 hypothetical protein [Pseudoalteromonas luteoviolacea DSM 6061]